MKPKNLSKENRRFIHGSMIINATAGSLNLGKDGIKRVTTMGENGQKVTFSYLSGQFIKAKIKEILIENGETLSLPEIIEESGTKKTPTTSCNPFKYIDDDLFGYMNVIESGKHINPGTTRIAPFKISYFLGKEGDLTRDYGVKQNGALVDGKLTTRPLDDNNRYFASTSYSGCFSFDVNNCGRFYRGNIAGFKNLSKNFPIEDYKNIIENEHSDDVEIVLKENIRSERIQKIIKTLPYLSGGAHRSTVYTDLSPKFVVYCVTNSGNHLFQEIASIYEHFNINSLIEAVSDFRENLKSDIFIALKNGFLESKRNEILNALIEYNKNEKNIYKFNFEKDLGGINTISKKFADEIIPDLLKIQNI
ncbi:MAG: type I-B CRISPR-associated protein Cas7/Cst2/DevR [bacterium]